LLYNYYLLFVLIFFSAELSDASNAKTLELHQKIAEIETLQTSINDKIASAAEKRKELILQINELEREIRYLIADQGISSYQQAVKSDRIRYDLKLILQLTGYADKLYARIEYFQIGNETLNFYYQQIEDDLMLINTLNDLEIEQLNNRISAILKEYIPETQKHLIAIDHTESGSIQSLWNKIAEDYSKVSQK